MQADSEEVQDLQYSTNLRVLTPGNPFRYQILKSDFTAPHAYQVNLLNTKDRVIVKKFKANVKAK